MGFRGLILFNWACQNTVMPSILLRECCKAFSFRFYLLALFFSISCTVHSENITFEDSYVRQLCVNEWDEDGDGELSISEAAKVISLGTVFKGNTNIKLFRELRFFTGLKSIDAYAFYKTSLTDIELPNGISSIEEYAFGDCQIGPEIIIPGSVKNICNNSFRKCDNLTKVYVEEGVETIGSFAFSAPLEVLSLPSSITYLSHQFVDPFVGGNTSSSGGMSFPDGIFYLYFRAHNPPSCHYNAFYRLYGESYLVVPFGSKERYNNDSSFFFFYKIFEYGDVNEDGFVNIADVVAVVNHILGKENARFNELIADVNGDGTINIADVIAIIDCILSD